MWIRIARIFFKGGTINYQGRAGMFLKLKYTHLYKIYLEKINEDYRITKMKMPLDVIMY